MRRGFASYASNVCCWAREREGVGCSLAGTVSWSIVKLIFCLPHTDIVVVIPWVIRPYVLRRWVPTLY
jgi:hypothetical protein